MYTAWCLSPPNPSNFEPFEGIDRIEESKLTYELWFREYLAKARPLIIVHDNALEDSTEIAPGRALSKQVQDDLIKACGDKEVNLMTPQLMKFYEIVEKGPLKTVVSAFMYLLHGTSLDGWRRDRLRVPLREVASLSSSRAKSSSRVSDFAAKFLPHMLQTISNLISSPPYLADLRPEAVCREVFSKKGHEHSRQFVRDDAHPFMQWT
eukprot:CAMPEP_0182482078 /NCGR_PEP_ID=MMETSP1319-20130603/38552_1 /TAXON_ID=172717 /ORGANISM="Bolidomonas pacifica, Strain RCC208" /LENGTH=207 /DNA_ID=CAMNT_0024683757 /DNA_START=9 /DNA_END=628 /DNA_ORIENTATION=-